MKFTQSLICLLIFIGSAAQAGTLVLQQEQAAVRGSTNTLHLYIEDAPAFYAAEVILAYDPEAIAVVDSDNDRAGVQIQHAPSLPKDGSFVLANEVRQGKIHFASTLVYPSEPIQGDARLASVALKALKAGETTLTIVKAELGRGDGTLIKTRFKPSQTIQLYANAEAAKAAQGISIKDLRDEPLLFIIGGIIVILLLVIILLQLRK